MTIIHDSAPLCSCGRVFRRKQKKQFVRCNTHRALWVPSISSLAILVFAGVYLRLHYTKIYITVPATLIITVAMLRSAFMMHDATHRLLARRRSLNTLFGEICGLWIIIPLQVYSYFHLKHHAYELTDRDPGNLEHLASRLKLHPTILQWIVLLTGTQLSTLQTAVAAVPLILLKGQWQYALEYLGVAVFFGILVLSGVFIEIWLMPYLIASVIANILLISQHELTVSRASKFTRSRTIVSNRFVSWMLYNGNYHLEHHLFPKVPSRYLPKCMRFFAKLTRSKAL
jgi:fatty acid desaturase